MRIPGVKYVQGRNSYTDRDGTKYGVAIHNTSNTAAAAGEASYATRRTDGVSAHLYVDGVEVIQSIDLLARTGHAGSSTGNENAISVEITGLNSWTRQQWLDRVNWSALGAALAWCCRQFGIAVRRASVGEMQSNPKVRAFYSHDDMRRAWGGTDHTDPGPAFPWDRLFQAVNAALGGSHLEENDMPPSPQDLVAVWTHDLKDGPGAEPAYRVLLRAADGVDALRAAAAASAQREADLAAAVAALTGLLTAGGGDVDTAAVVASVVAHIDQRSADVAGRVAELEQALAERDARLAAALAGS